MADPEFTPPDWVRNRARSRGAAGEAWLADLPRIVAEAAQAWDFDPVSVMSGGTEALVVSARTASGREAVLKAFLPGSDPDGAETRVLLAARGRGYAEVLAHDAGRGLLLLERLGPQLHELGWPVDDQLRAICATLQEAWAAPPGPGPFITGAEKAAGLADWIEDQWAAQGRPCPRAVVDRALAHAEARARADRPGVRVLAHGDAHAWNTLLVPGSDPPRFKLVDPDGLLAEPAYDLAIPMREWSKELLAGDPVAGGRARCARLAELTGCDPAAIWAWGFVERVSTGLGALAIDMVEEGRDMLAVAEAWAAAEA